MKNITLIIFTLVSITSMAAVKTTLADGDWFDANNWSPSGVPFYEDTVIINHNITVTTNYVDYIANWMIVNSGASIVCDTIFGLHGNLKVLGTMDMQTLAVGDGDSTLIYGTVTGSHFAPGNPININYGNVTSDTLSAGADFINHAYISANLMTSGAYFENNQDITALQFASGGELINNWMINADTMTVSGDFHNYWGVNSDVFTFGGNIFQNHDGAAIVATSAGTLSPSTNALNDLGATIEAGSLVTADNVTNNGDISCTMWTHGSGTVTGVTGRFCVAQCFVNNATINGTVDICDATPGSFCDINMGSIAATVTYCANGACDSNVGAEEVSAPEFVVYPNPASDQLFVEAVNGGHVTLIDLKGQVCTRQQLNAGVTTLDLSALNVGMYLISVEKDGLKTVKKIIVE